MIQQQQTCIRRRRCQMGETDDQMAGKADHLTELLVDDALGTHTAQDSALNRLDSITHCIYHCDAILKAKSKSKLCTLAEASAHDKPCVHGMFHSRLTYLFSKSFPP